MNKIIILVARQGFLKDKCGPRAKTLSTTALNPNVNRRATQTLFCSKRKRQVSNSFPCF